MLGDYTELLTGIGKDLGWDIILPPPLSEETLQIGVKCMNELMCLPAKSTLGSLVESCERGAEHLFTFDSCGQCRMKTYWILQERVLRKLGYNVKMHPITLGRHTISDIRAIDPSVSYFRACRAFFKLICRLQKIDREREAEMLKETGLVKIGVVGEIYTVLEKAVNHRLFARIKNMGAVVHNSLPLSYFVFKGFYNRGWMKRRDMDNKALKVAKKKAHEYFPKEIGGHGNESIIHTIYYALKGFDGVIHVLPFPCMPESTIAPILDDIGHDYNMPVMRLIFDVHSGEAGLLTRLEAFIDILKMKKGMKR